MNTREKNCIDGEIVFNNKLGEKGKNEHHKKKLQRKKQNSNLNFRLSIVVFLIMLILALIIILNKGKFGEFSLVYVGDDLVHTAELECDSYYLSVLDNESTTVSLTIDGVEKDEGYTLKSSDEKIAKIENGLVTAGENAGVATITAYFEKYDMNISTEVVTYIPINTVTAVISSSRIKVGETAEISIDIIPENGTDDYITYTSSDKNIVTVDKDGVVTGVSSGTATITINDELTGASATKKVTVK